MADQSNTSEEQDPDTAEDREELTGTPPILEFKGHKAHLSKNPDADEEREGEVEQLVEPPNEDSEDNK